jgi:HSP20 family protein
MFSLISRPTSGLASEREPFGLIDAMFSDWLGQRAAASSLVSRARLDVSERDNSYEVRAELPGAKKEDIAIEIDGAWVSIKAKTQRRDERKEGAKVLYTELSHESYARAFELPQPVDSASAKAAFENGVLTLTLPKRAASTTQRLTVQ